MSDNASAAQYKDEFTRLIEDELYGFVCEAQEQEEKFQSVYEYDLLDYPPVVQPLGRTIATDIEPRYKYDLVSAATVTAIKTFYPGHTNIEQVPDMDFLGRGTASVELFRCKNTEGEDQLFVCEVLEHGYEIYYLSMIGPLNLREMGLLVPENGTIAHQLSNMEEMGLIELFNELTRMRLELERRSDLMANAATSLIDPSDGLGSIGGDNLELVSQMLLRM